MSTALVSIVIPTYARPVYLRRAVESVLAQTHTNWELLIVDDNPPDSDSRRETRDLVDSLTPKGSMTYLLHDSNRGGAAARNTGIEHARGEYVAFLDDDDEWLPEKLARQLAVFEHSAASLALVYTGFTVVDTVKGEVWDIEPRLQGRIAHELLKKNYVGTTSTILCRREALLEVGMFDAALPAKQDVDLYIRLARQYEIAYVAEPLVKFYRHAQPSIGKNIEAALAAHEHFYAKHRDLLENNRSAHVYRLISEGKLFLQVNKVAQARRNALRALSLHPTDRAALKLLAFASLGNGLRNSVRKLRRRVSKRRENRL